MSESQSIVEVVNLEVEMQMTQSSPHIRPRPTLGQYYSGFSCHACVLLSAAYIESYKQLFFIANTDINARTNKSVDVRMFFEVAAIPAYRPKTFRLPYHHRRYRRRLNRH